MYHFRIARQATLCYAKSFICNGLEMAVGLAKHAIGMGNPACSLGIAMGIPGDESAKSFVFGDEPGGATAIARIAKIAKDRRDWIRQKPTADLRGWTRIQTECLYWRIDGRKSPITHEMGRISGLTGAAATVNP